MLIKLCLNCSFFSFVFNSFICALYMITSVIKPNGILISKLFMGTDFLEVKKLAKSKFKKVQFFKPEASRNESRETYIHCTLLNTL